MRNPSTRSWPRRIIRFVAGLFVVLLITLSILYFRQHSLVYHPHPYDESYVYALPANGLEINYTVATAKYVAYYVPGIHPTPKRLWIAFCGNGSLALDWTTILAGYPRNGDAFLLVDYPGYGKNAGYATIDSTRASADAALEALWRHLALDPGRVTLCTIGHSLGAAVAIDFAAHSIQRMVAISPFTTLRKEAARIVGGPLSHLL